MWRRGAAAHSFHPGAWLLGPPTPAPVLRAWGRGAGEGGSGRSGRPEGRAAGAPARLALGPVKVSSPGRTGRLWEGVYRGHRGRRGLVGDLGLFFGDVVSVEESGRITYSYLQMGSVYSHF